MLPYADDIRDLDAVMEAANIQKNTMDNLTKEEKHAARLIIKNLSIDFNSRNFENPTIQRFYSGLQALALNEDEPEPVEDLLEPDYEGMKMYQPVIQKFKDAFFGGDESDPECSGTAGKSRAGAGNARKRPAPENLKKKVVHTERIRVESEERD